MNEEDIQSILDKLGNRVSILSEENRKCKLEHNACKELISQLDKLIKSDDWIELYESCENNYIKDLMKKWGSHIFPENYKII